MVVLALMLSGCNGTLDPVINGMGNHKRSAQFFGTPESWGEGYSIDSASTISVYPSELAFCGSICMNDIISTYKVDLMVTAVVKHTTTVNSEIDLVMYDQDGTEVYEDLAFSAGGESPPYARHPSVEVTYERAPEAPKGTLRCHIVWAELKNGDPFFDDFWVLYYRMITWEIDGSDTEVDWYNETSDSTAQITWAFLTDSLQPDLCVNTAKNDLWVVYLEQSESSSDRIMAKRHLYANIGSPGTWDSSHQASNTSSRTKYSPAVDSGRINFNEAQQHTYGNTVAVWCENTSTAVPELYQIFYNDWDCESIPTYTNAEQISEDGEDGLTSNILPQIDVTPRSSRVHEAAITWTALVLDEDGDPLSSFVNITVTPYMGHYQTIPNSRYSRCSDVAWYQMEADEHWVGISYHKSTTFSDTYWDVYAQALSIDMDYVNGTFTVYPEDDTSIPADAAWNGLFTVTTLALREPYDITTTVDQEFIIGWHDGSDFEVTTAIGTLEN